LGIVKELSKDLSGGLMVRDTNQNQIGLPKGNLKNG